MWDRLMAACHVSVEPADVLREGGWVVKCGKRRAGRQRTAIKSSLNCAGEATGVCIQK